MNDVGMVVAGGHRASRDGSLGVMEPDTYRGWAAAFCNATHSAPTQKVALMYRASFLVSLPFLDFGFP